MQFELEATVLNGKVVTNAKELLANIDNGLKHYDYVVTENTYEQAKKDRAQLNSIVKMVSDERKRVEDDLFSEWKEDKKNIMDIEKKIKQCADSLGQGITDIEDVLKEEKRKHIYEAWQTLLDSKGNGEHYDLTPKFNEKWLNKTTSNKSIEKDLNAIYDKIIQDLGFMETFLPNDETDIAQIKEVYFQDYDLMRAKVKADDLKRIRETVERQKQKEEQIVQEPLHFEQSIPNEPENKVVEQNTNWAEFRVEGTREQLLELTKVLVNLRNNTSFEFKVTNKGEL
ncbi:hypothetical protein B5F14_01835 [Faecalitalea cylindroides]|uniref:DUF1351 domain-containing protein n=1 Tax=Faecalitalea cylindroides TaxID=39483 RepID=A0A1Y4LYQ3_9FIRM|nr:DUF1351 domain-containing protein [Faecalitalea cylindroides]OUP61723.1 hypothetical protein B5F14_01835 [Faecalitalea cylindroides]